MHLLHQTQVNSRAVFTANHMTDSNQQNSTGNTQTKQNTKSKQHTIQQNKPTLVQSPLTTVGQEMRWAYCTTLLSPHQANKVSHIVHEMKQEVVRTVREDELSIPLNSSEVVRADRFGNNRQYRYTDLATYHSHRHHPARRDLHPALLYSATAGCVQVI